MVKKVVSALFLIFLLSACRNNYYVIKTEGTGIKGYASEDSDVYLTEPYEGDPKQYGRIYARIKMLEKNIINVSVHREDVKKGTRYYYDPGYNSTFELIDIPVVIDNNGQKINIIKTNVNSRSESKEAIYGKNVDIYLEKDTPESLMIDLGRIKIKDEIYNTGKIYLKKK